MTTGKQEAKAQVDYLILGDKQSRDSMLEIPAVTASSRRRIVEYVEGEGWQIQSSRSPVLVTCFIP